MSNERRQKARYPLQLAVQYQTLDKKTPVSGVGRTTNFSSGGILIEAQHNVTEGSRLRVTIEWPSLLNGTTPLQLITTGRVVRCEETSLAVALERYQFRTMRRRALVALTAPRVAAAMASPVQPSATAMGSGRGGSSLREPAAMVMRNAG